MKAASIALLLATFVSSRVEAQRAKSRAPACHAERAPAVQQGPSSAAVRPTPPASGASFEESMQAGLAAVRASDWRTAIERFTHAHLLQPDHPIPLYNLGLAQMTSGHPTAAMAWWEAYLAASPTADNAPRVRSEIDRLRRGVIETIRNNLEAAWSGLQQLDASERARQKSTVTSAENRAKVLFAAEATDSIRLTLAAAVGSQATPLFLAPVDAALFHLDRVKDTAVRHATIESAARGAAQYNPAAARRYALRLPAGPRRDATLRAIDDADRIARFDTTMYAQIRAGEYPAQAILTHLSEWRDHRFRAIVQKLARAGLYREAMQLAASPAEESVVLIEVAAAKLRAGDFSGAQRDAREFLRRNPISRDEITLAAGAVRCVETRDPESGFQIVMSGVSNPSLRWNALATMAIVAKAHGDAATADRAEQLKSTVQGGPLDWWTFALSVNEDYETALALSTIANRDDLFYWFDGGIETAGHVWDYLTGTTALEGGLAKIAFVSALRGKDRETRRAIEMATDPVRRYVVYRNVAWAHVAAGRVPDALKAIATWPVPPDGNITAVRAYEFSRAQVLAAAAVRAARLGRFSESEQALDLFAPPGVGRSVGAVLASLAADAALQVGQAHAARGDATSARRLYARSAAALRAYHTDAVALLSSRYREEEHWIAPVLARLSAVDPEAGRSAVPARRPEIAVWSRLALGVSAESPAALLARMLERDARQLPTAYSDAVILLFPDLMSFEAARPGWLVIPTGVTPPRHAGRVP